MNAYLARLMSGTPLISDTGLAMLTVEDERLTVAAEAFGAALGSRESAEHPAFQRLRDQLNAKAVVMDDGIAIVPINGPLAYRPDLFEMAFYGVQDSSHMAGLLGALSSDDAIRGVLLSIHSPGGEVTGGFELAEVVTMLAGRKPVVAHTGGMMASLAYLVGSQANEVVASTGAQVGSIGVIASWLDWSGLLERAGIKAEVFTNAAATFKGIGVFGKPLTDAQRDHMQQEVESIFQSFAATVRSARPSVPDEAMRGQVYRGAAAKRVGLIDRVGSYDFSLSVLRARVRAWTANQH